MSGGVLSRARAEANAWLELGRAERRAASVGKPQPSMWRRGFLSTRSFMYPGIHDPGVLYVNDVRTYRRIRTVNGPAAQLLVQHKNVFADSLVARGLGEMAPETYGTVSDRGFRPRSEAAHARLLEQEAVVVKPVRGHGGRGVRLLSPDQVLESTAARGAELLVQERLSAHPLLDGIWPGSLNTLRVLAVRVADGTTVLAAAAHRFGTAETVPVDNGSSGGLWAPVDVETGRMGAALRHPQEPRRCEYPAHPDTGARIDGVVVPGWADVRQLVLQLMAAFPETDHVGWDVALTDQGPRVIEGNGVMPALSMFQYSGSFLDDPRLRDFYVRHGLLSRRVVRRAERAGRRR